MLGQAVLQIISAILASSSITGALVAWLQRKNRKQRAQDLKDQETERKNLEAQRDQIGMTAQAEAIKTIRGELSAAYKDVAYKRKAIQAQDEKIDAQDLKIDHLEEVERKQLRRIAALEDWCQKATLRLTDCGITDMPPVPHIEA